ncbi:hypothetical protein Peur_020763 [Populus x canadensis]
MCVNCIFSQKVHLFSVRVLSQVASSVFERVSSKIRIAKSFEGMNCKCVFLSF